MWSQFWVRHGSAFLAAGGLTVRSNARNRAVQRTVSTVSPRADSWFHAQVRHFGKLTCGWVERAVGVIWSGCGAGEGRPFASRLAGSGLKKLSKRRATSCAAKVKSDGLDLPREKVAVGDEVTLFGIGFGALDFAGSFDVSLVLAFEAFRIAADDFRGFVAASLEALDFTGEAALEFDEL